MNQKSDHAAPLRVAVVTGGHSFDTIPFHQLFRRLPGIDAYVQNIDDWGYAPPSVRASYDVVVLYVMMLDGPSDQGLPWYAGKRLTALNELGASEQGIVVLHHALLAFPDWQPWSEMAGIAKRTFGFHWTGAVATHVVDSDHPITHGLPASWELGDETYTMDEPEGPDIHLLLATTHEPSMHAIAWINRFKKARVFCYQSGHGASVYENPNFREVLARGIQWVACEAKMP